MKVSTRTLLVSVAVTGLVAGGTGAVLAGHQFSDVSNSHPFHDEISAIADAGERTVDEASGCSDRETTSVVLAMAAFMQRGSSRGRGRSRRVTGQKTIAAGATGGGNGFVLVNAAVTACTTDVANCPCEIYAYVVRASDGSVVAFPNRTTMPGQVAESGDTSTATSATGVAELPADTSETIR